MKGEAGGEKLSFLRMPYHLGQSSETLREPRESFVLAAPEITVV